MNDGPNSFRSKTEPLTNDPVSSFASIRLSLCKTIYSGMSPKKKKKYMLVSAWRKWTNEQLSGLFDNVVGLRIGLKEPFHLE